MSADEPMTAAERVRHLEAVMAEHDIHVEPWQHLLLQRAFGPEATGLAATYTITRESAYLGRAVNSAAEERIAEAAELSNHLVAHYRRLYTRACVWLAGTVVVAFAIIVYLVASTS